MSTDKIADLKAKFVAGAIPLDSDYATLLNMLEETRAATGTSPDAPKSTTLTTTPGSCMNVAVVPDGGLATGTEGVRVDPRWMWAKLQAVGTGATSYGVWDNGYTFMYVTDDKGGRKFCFCNDAGYQVNVGATTDIVCYAADASTLYNGNAVARTYVEIDGWTERNPGELNTFDVVLSSADAVVTKVLFITGAASQPSDHGYLRSVLLVNV